MSGGRDDDVYCVCHASAGTYVFEHKLLLLLLLLLIMMMHHHEGADHNSATYTATASYLPKCYKKTVREGRDVLAQRPDARRQRPLQGTRRGVGTESRFYYVCGGGTCTQSESLTISESLNLPAGGAWVVRCMGGEEHGW